MEHQEPQIVLHVEQGDVQPEIDSGAGSVVMPSNSSSDNVSTSRNLVVRYTPNGSEQWLRTVGIDFTPKIGTVFRSLDEGIEFYKTYAKACGFEARLHTARVLRNGLIRKKIVVCNRQGFRANRKRKRSVDGAEQKLDSGVHRRVKLSRIGCPAKIALSFVDGFYVVDEFNEAHNHRLCSVSESEMQKASRALSIFHKQLIVDHSKLNIGAAKTFRICKEYADGYTNVGASLVDFKNFQRDVKCFIGSKDAQLFIDHFQKLFETTKGFYFKHDVDDANNLRRVFWADSISRLNYSLYGDSVSYDPTYGTNKYSMVFTPFTGVNHHKKSVTFASCLLSHEDEESFKWAFRMFLDAMGQKEPQCIITDQDPALKKAIPAVFKVARHRFCMWHIMEKVNEKVGGAICRDTDFLDRLASVVWNPNLEPMEFEQQWLEVIRDFSLEDNSWLSTMFSVRHKWIPAYFRDFPMGCLLRTTQRSESENSYFKRFENHFGTLVEFWLRFKTAMDQQRYTQKCLDKDSDHSMPVTVTPLPLESHAASVYTHKVFYEFQKEVEASLFSCSVGGFTRNEGIENTDVDDSGYQKTFKVVFNSSTKEASCSCKLFERMGLLCRHIIWVYSGKGVTRIPNQYILSRWCKKAHRPLLFDCDGNVIEDHDVSDSRQGMLSDLWSEFYATVNVLKTLPEDVMKELVVLLKQFRGKISGKAAPLTKDQEIALLLGCDVSTNVTILPPNASKNKGSGKRLVSNKKKCVGKAKKQLRRCANCKQKAAHNRRTCKLPFVEITPETDSETEGSSAEFSE